MLFQNVSVLDEQFSVLRNTDVRIKDGTICEIGQNLFAEDEECIDGSGKLLMSGFYNIHTHMPMTLMRGYGENLPLDRWLNDKIFPFEDRLNGEYAYYATLLGIAEMLRYGTVSATDMYFFSDKIAQACIESGFKANIARCVVCFDDSGIDDLQNVKEAKALLADFDGYDNDRIKIDLSIHAEYSITERVARELADYAKTLHTRMQLHVSETEKEHLECIERHGKTPIAFFNDTGILDTPTTAAHCVYVTPKDLAIMHEKGVTVAHCPVSNLKLASGIAPIKAMLQSGVRVGLGTDGVASNNNLNMLEEIKLAAILHKGAQRDPMLVSAEQALGMATVNGALAQGRENCGAVKVGNRADLILVDLSAPNMQPEYTLCNNLVYAATPSEITMTMVDGRILYHNGEYKTIDMEKVSFEVNRIKDRILSVL